MLFRSAESALVRLLVLIMSPRVSMISRFSSRSSSSNSSIIATAEVAHILGEGQARGPPRPLDRVGARPPNLGRVAGKGLAVLPEAGHGLHPGPPKKPENAR